MGGLWMFLALTACSNEQGRELATDRMLADAMPLDAQVDVATDVTRDNFSAGDASDSIGTCELNRGGCSVHATCTDTRTGPECACAEGFSGDGRICLGRSLTLEGEIARPSGSMAFGSEIEMSADGHTLAVVDVLTGIVRLYTYQNSGWIPDGELDTGGAFGQHIELSSDGATLAVTLWQRGIRSVQTFRREKASWRPDTVLNAPATGRGGQFGFAVALSTHGDVMVVGSCDPILRVGRRETETTYHGEAFVYRRAGTGWTSPTMLSSPPYAERLWYGCNLAINGTGTRIVVTDSAARVAGLTGRVFVYEFGDAGWTSWREVTRPALAPPGGYFGGGLALSEQGSRLILDDGGRAHIYDLSQAEWTSVAHVTLPSSLTGYRLELSATGRQIFVADQNADPRSGGSGVVYVFSEGANGWSQPVLLARPEDSLVAFGHDIAVSSDAGRVVVSAWENYNSRPPGRIFTYQSTPQ